MSTPTSTTPNTHTSIIRPINPPTVRDVSAIYSHATTTLTPSRLIYTAGQVGTYPPSHPTCPNQIPPDGPTQARLAFANLKSVLEEAGATAKDVLKITYFIVGYDEGRRWHVEPLMEFLGDARPAITSLGVEKLARGSYLFEVEAVAAVPF